MASDNLKERLNQLKPPESGGKPKLIKTKSSPGGPMTPGAKKKKKKKGK